MIFQNFSKLSCSARPPLKCRGGARNFWVVASGGKKRGGQYKVGRKHKFRLRQCAWRHCAVSCAKTAEPIDLPFGLWTRVGRKKHKFNRIFQVAPMANVHKFNRIRQVAPMCHHGRALRRHLANTIEPCISCGDVALCQITLATCYTLVSCDKLRWLPISFSAL